MRKLSAALLIYLGLASAALAQTVTNPLPNAGNYGAYNLSPPTCANGSGCWLQTDINGRLIVIGAGGSAGSVTQGTVPWVVSGQGTAGTAATGVLTVQGIAAMTPFLTTTTLNAETTKVIGTVNQGTSPWVVSNGGTFAVQAAQSTAANLNATVVGTGTFAVQAATQGAVNITLTDCSGTIASGGAAQNAFTASASRHGFTIANIDTTEPLWISFTTTAAASGTGSYPLAAADATTFANLTSFTSPPGMGINTALSVIGATTSHKYTCTVW